MDSDTAADTFGELTAYKFALDAVIASHPRPAMLFACFETARQRGLVVLLAEPIPDRALASFESTIDALQASAGQAAPRD